MGFSFQYAGSGCASCHGPTGPEGPQGPTGPTGPPGAGVGQSFLFVWTTQEQSLAPTPAAGEQGEAVTFTDDLVVGPALSFTGPAQINILESGYYNISWEVYKWGYDSAFALFFDAGTGAQMVPGSNYGAMAHDEIYRGQAISFLSAGGTLTLNRIDSLYTQTIFNQVSGGASVTGASVVVVKIG